MLSAQAMSEPRPSFDRPPVAEVVCGIRFAPIPGFTTPHVGLLWQQHFIAEFPTTEHKLPLGIEPERFFNLDDLLFPRIWFISSDERSLIQLQKDRFHFNWRRRELNDKYPRFPAIFDWFTQRLNQFVSFLQAHSFEPPAVTTAELTYVNHIPLGEGWNSYADLGNIFRDFCWRKSGHAHLPEPGKIYWRASFKIGEKTELVVRSDAGHRKVDEKELLVLNLTVSGPSEELGTNLRDWFYRAHHHIVWGFVDITDEKMQREVWGRTA